MANNNTAMEIQTVERHIGGRWSGRIYKNEGYTLEEFDEYLWSAFVRSKIELGFFARILPGYTEKVFKMAKNKLIADLKQNLNNKKSESMK